MSGNRVETRPTVGVYLEHYLTPSMTFIHRQLVGVTRAFRPVVLTQATDHLDLFPFEPIHVQAQGLLEKPLTRTACRVLGRSSMLGPWQRRTFARILASEGASLVHAHFGPSAIQVLPVARSLDMPLLATFHGYDASSLLRLPAFSRDLRRLFAWPKTHVIAVSDFMAEELRRAGAPAERTRVLRYGIPTSDFACPSRSSPRDKAARGEGLVCLQACNFVEKKGHELTVRAFAELAARRPDVRLLLAGDGPLRKRIEALVRELGLADRVQFTGRATIGEVASLMKSADVFAHPSVTAADGDREGIPNVIMEAMAAGLPVVSTFHAGIPELIENGVSGLLVDERDVPALARALEQALTTGPEMGLNAMRRVADAFDIAKQNETLAAIYREVLSSS